MKSTADHRSSPTLHFTIFLLTVAFAVSLTASIILRVEIVARGKGKVVPAGQVKVVQSEFPGKIGEILVKDGDQVEVGQGLITFDSTDAAGRRDVLQSEIILLKIERARVSTFANKTLSAKQLDQDLLSISRLHFDGLMDNLRGSEILNDKEERFQQEQAEQLMADVTAIIDRMQQIESRKLATSKSVDISSANLDRINTSLAIQRQRLDAAKNLLEKKVTSESIYLDVLEQFSRLENERELYLREIDQKWAQVQTYVAEAQEVVSSARRIQLARRTAIDSRLATIEPQLILAKRELAAASLKAAVSGIIEGLEVHTTGGVVAAGSDLMKIVPSDANPIIEAVFTNADVGFLSVGQHANIKLDAFPSERFGYVKGEVANVAADSTEVTEGVWGFEARIKPSISFLKAPTGRHSLKPGMTVVVDVVTGERRLISYFFAPIVEAIQGSLGER